jgi:hypothetical protein
MFAERDEARPYDRGSSRTSAAPPCGLRLPKYSAASSLLWARHHADFRMMPIRGIRAAKAAVVGEARSA